MIRKYHNHKPQTTPWRGEEEKELKGLVKPETASSTRSTLHLSRLDISFQGIEELFQYIELWCDE